MSGEPGFEVRTARGDDLGAVAGIETVSFADPWPLQSLATELKRDGRLRVPLVACRGREVVGYLLAWHVVDQLHILNLAVRPDLRRQGVATRLLEGALHYCRRRRLAEMTLEVRRSNGGAVAFYLKHAFAVVGCRPRYYQDNGEDALIMTRVLAPEPH